MKCYSARRYLEKMAADEINGRILRLLEEHLQTCSGCRGEYQEMKEILAAGREVSQLKTIPQFTSAWRQRVRQEAFKKEIMSRHFWAVFKANTLIPALGVLVVLVVLGMSSFISKHFLLQAEIEPEIHRYSPAQSAMVGIPLVVRFANGKAPRDITYHWTAEYGRFLSWVQGKVSVLGAEAMTEEPKVYWGVDFEDQRESSNFKIRLQVEAARTGRAIARAELRLERDGEGVFWVKD